MPDGDLSNIKALLDEQGQTFEAFKEKTDALEAQVSKLGEDAVTRAEQEKVNSALSDVTEKVKAALEERKRINEAVEKMQEELDRIETLAKRTGTPSDEDKQAVEVQKAARKWAAQWHGVIDTDVTVDEYTAYTRAFDLYLRKGGKMKPDDAKALQVGVDADGGYWVTPAILDRVITRIFETSPMRSVATVETIGTDALEYPIDSNDAVSGGWVGETDSRAETNTPQIGQGRIPVHEQYANPRVTQKLLDDAAFDVEGWLARKTADKMVRTENEAFVDGNGVAKPRGFLDYGADSVTTDDSSRDWGVLQYVASGGASDFASSNPGDPLIELVHKLKQTYRQGAAWAMNRATVGEVRKLKDGDGNYLWSMGNIQTGQPQALLGYPVVEMEDMPDIAANAYAIAFGNWATAYMIVERQGIRTLRDPYSAKPYIQFYTTKRVGGDVVNFDAIKLFKFASS